MTAKKVKVPAASAKVNDAQVAGAAVSKPAKAAKPVKVSKDAKSVVVNDKNGEFIREYSEDVHGEDFVTLAEEFASKEEGRVVVG